MKRLVVVCLLCALPACSWLNTPRYQPISSHALAGWHADNHAEALAAFRKSCRAKMHPDFAESCRKAQGADNARAFFQSEFNAYEVTTGRSEAGFVTGYYEPVMLGSLSVSPEFPAPLYAAPNPTPTPDSPFATREAIEANAMLRGTEVLWLEDKVQAFFLQIQGSGKVLLPDGRMITAQYAGKNHQPYTPIGRVLKERGELEPDKVSLQTIREWLYAHPEQADEVMQQNDAFVFFTVVENAEPAKGAQGVAVTAERSLAVDRRFTPYGTPIFVQTELADGTPYARLLIAQDTGGAIKGPMRGDIFFGRGKQAEAKAGGLQAPARWVMLWPKGSNPHAATQTTD